MLEVTIRDERPGDEPAIFAVNEAAFGQPEEAKLVDLLRDAEAAVVSLVAEVDGEIVGHILFSPVLLEPERAGLEVAGLGPMAAKPGMQRGGIGSALIAEGLRRCRELGYAAVVLLGHPSYYPRFGFVPAHRFALRCEFPSPPEAFMAIELVRGALAAGPPALVRYHPAFRSV